MIRLVVHGGYGKTASTFLQEDVFSKLDNILYLGKFPQDKMLTEEIAKAFADVFMPAEIDSVPRSGNSALVVPILGDVLLDLVQQTGKKTVLISDENIFDYGNNCHTELNRYLIMELLKYMRSRCSEDIELKTMMTIRNQKEILKSFFTFDYHHLQSRFSSFDKFIQYGLENKSRIVFGGYHYDLVLEAMQDLYGVDNVRFFLYEQMKENVEAYVNQILSYIGVPAAAEGFDLTRKANVTNKKGEYSATALKQSFLGLLLSRARRACKDNIVFSKLENVEMFRLLRNAISSLVNKRTEVTVSFSIQQQTAIDALYSESNAKLGRMLNIDVERYGYACNTPADSLG